MSGEFEKLRAETIVASLGSVIDVVNNLAVVSELAVKTDAEILADTRLQLLWIPLLNFEDIRVSVDNGQVTLTGSVDSPLQARMAKQEAYDAGAHTVHLVVQVRDSSLRDEIG